MSGVTFRDLLHLTRGLRRWGCVSSRAVSRPTVRMTTWHVSARSFTDPGLSPLGRCCEQRMPHSRGLMHGRCRPRAPLPACSPLPGCTWDEESRVRSSPAPPKQSSPSCRVLETGSTTPGVGVGSGPPAQQPRPRPCVWEAPLPGSLSSLPGEPLRAFQVQ